MKALHKKVVIVVLLLLTSSVICYAQPGPPDDPDVPITGIEILLAAGGALGIRKLIQRRKAQQ